MTAAAAAPAGPLFPLHASSFRRGFTLLEVMIAGGILFMCLFAVLALVANGLRNARTLQASRTDPRGSIASQLGYELAHTNSLAEGTGSGEFGDYKYEWELKEIETNGLCEVDILVDPSSRLKTPSSTFQMVMYLPQIQEHPGGGPPGPN